MTPAEFTAAKAKLGLSYSELAEAIGKSPRATMGYAAGNTIPKDVQIIINMLLNEQKWDEFRKAVTGGEPLPKPE